MATSRRSEFPLIAGRGFEATDRADSPPLLVVNQRFAESFYPKRIRWGSGSGSATEGQPLEIVGVAKATRYLSPVEPPFWAIYEPLSQNPADGA